MQEFLRSKANRTTTTRICLIVVSFAITIPSFTTATLISGNLGYTIGDAWAQMQTMNATSSTMTPANATTTAATITNVTAVSGKLIYDERGHIDVNRVIRVTNNSAAVEAFYSASTTYNGTLLKDTGTANYTLRNVGGLFSGTGQGFLTNSTSGDIATYTLQFTGHLDAQGNANVTGSIHFEASTVKLASSLSTIATNFNAKATPQGDFSLQALEPK